MIAVTFDPDEWGNVAEWVAAIGALLAFGAAGLLLRHEQQLRQADADERLRDQARRISCWIEDAPPDRFMGDVTRIVCIQNASDESIYGVQVFLTGVDDIAGKWINFPPGRTKTEPWRHGRREATVTFIDSAGNFWRRGLGGLELIARAPTYKNTK